MRTRLCEDRLISADDLASELEHFDLPVYFFGDGTHIARKAFPKCKATPDAMVYQNASSVASVALELYNSSKDKSLFNDTMLRPVYLRDSQAEREYKQKNGGADNE